MSDLVSAGTGELVDIADHEEARRLIAEVSGAIAHMNVWTGRALDAICEAHDRKAWVSAGLGSWDELVEAKNWNWKPLTTTERQAVGEIFRQKGFSLRAVGALLSASPQTIRRDLIGKFDSDSVPNGTSTPAEIEAVPTQPERPAPVEETEVHEDPDSDEVDSEEHSPGLPVESSLPTAEVDASLERSASTSATPPLTHEEQHELDLQAAAERDARRIRQVLDGWGSVEGLPNSPLRDRVDSLLIDHDRNAVYALLERVSA